MIEISSIVQRKPQVSGYVVVVEVIHNGYVMAVFESLAEAQMLAHKIVARVQVSEDIPVEDLLGHFGFMASYSMNGDSTPISHAVWYEYLYMCEVYVVPIDLGNGGISQFVRERENCIIILSFADHLNRYKRAIDWFKPFGFLAN
jgi:hypothetical protein